MSRFASYSGRTLGAAIAMAGFTGLLLAAPPAVRADLPVAVDDFEDHASGPTGFGWQDDWQLESGARIVDSGNPFAGSSHLLVSGESAAATRSADVTGETALRLKLRARASGLEDGKGVIEVSGDGTSYTEVHRWGEGDGGGAAYSLFDFDVSATGISFSGTLWLRIRLTGDDDGSGSLFIDEIELFNPGADPDPPPPGAVPVSVDGQFGDWTGKANITDDYGDQNGSARHDIAAFYWANNIDQQVNYHLIERQTTDGQPFNGSNGQTNRTSYIVYIDTNDDGDYTDKADRRAVVSYVPRRDEGRVRVRIYAANSNSKISDSGWNDWGESRSEGGLRVEFPLGWDDLGIAFGGVIRMYVVSYTDSISSPDIEDRAPDGNADIQWSPASVLGPWLLGAAGVAGTALIWFLSRRRRLWK